MSVSLYGEVQKEVIQATLASDFGLDVTFRQTTTIRVDRLAGTGEAVEVLHAGTNPFLATLGLRVAPAPAGAGITVRLDVDIRLVPMYIYKTADAFTEMMARYIRDALREGLSGWPVNDCAVTVTDCGYVSPSTTAADFRKLTPLVLMAALRQAGTVVCEPMVRVSLEIPADAVGAILAAVARLGAVAVTPSRRTDLAVVEAILPAARAQDLTRQLPGLTSGEGVIETSFGGYRPVRGAPPARPRTMPNPLNREEYLLRLAGRARPRPRINTSAIRAEELVQRGQHVLHCAGRGDFRVAERQRDAHPVDGGDGEHGYLVRVVLAAEGTQLDAAPNYLRHQPPPGGVVAQRVRPHLRVADAEVPGLDPQPPALGRIRLVSGE